MIKPNELLDELLNAYEHMESERRPLLKSRYEIDDTVIYEVTNADFIAARDEYYRQRKEVLHLLGIAMLGGSDD